MIRRPWSLTLFALAMLGIALAMPIQAAYLQNPEEFFLHLSSLNWLVVVFCLASSWSILQAHRSFRFFVPVTLGLVTLNNWWVGSVGLDYDLETTGVATFGFLCVHGVLLEKRARQILRNPELKWWRRSPRKTLVVPIHLFPMAGRKVVQAQSFDISESGVFVQGLHEDQFGRLHVGDRFKVLVALKEDYEVACSGQIVRKCPALGTYPQGIAIRFNDLGWKERRLLRDFGH